MTTCVPCRDLALKPQLFAIFADDVAGEPLIRSLTHALLRLEPVSELSVVWAVRRRCLDLR